MQFNQDLFAQINWIPIANYSDLAIPPFAVLQPDGVDGEGFLRVVQPRADSRTDVYFNGPLTIPSGNELPRYGQATRTLPARVLFDPQLGEIPFFDEVWGTREGSWALCPGADGFKAMGAVDSSNNTAAFTGRDHSLVRLVQVIGLTKTGLYYPAVLYVFDTISQTGVTGEACWFLDLGEL